MKSHSLIFLSLLAVSCAKPGAVSNQDANGGSALTPLPPLPTAPFNPLLPNEQYQPRGIGGGGAMTSLSISPYAPLWFVGTDMGTLFRSVSSGASWHPVDQQEADFSSDLSSAAAIGFSADVNVVFHAKAGINPQRSSDQGLTWQLIPISLQAGEKIKYWRPDSYNADVIFCSTTLRLFRSSDRGLTWAAASGISGLGLGTYIDYASPSRTVYHALQDGIYTSGNGGVSFTQAFSAAGGGLRSFAAGRDGQNGLTLAYIDRDGVNACAWASSKPGVTAAQISGTQSDCGYVWVKRADATFTRLSQYGGKFIRMAENDSQTIYVAGGSWMRQYGSKVWVSRDAGASWAFRFHIYNWDVNPYAPWPADRLEYSPPGLEVGWHDNAYESLAIHQRDSSTLGGTGYYFLHVTNDYAEHWKAPFTEFADTGARVAGKKWRSVGLEVTSVNRLKFHPADTRIGYASLADMAGLVTDDGGESWRITKAQYNTNYDYAFDPALIDRVYSVSGSDHDWPQGWHGNPIVGNGGVYRSDNRGRTWTRLTPGGGGAFDRQFLSVAYDPSRTTLYAGSQGAGIARSTDGGASWNWFNAGLPAGTQIIPQIELDPTNGNAYALLTGDAPNYTNHAQTGIYFLDVQGGSTTWVLLRGSLTRPSGSGSFPLLQYPTAFAIDWNRPARDTFWLVDAEKNGQWMATGAWKSTDRGATWARSTQFTHPVGVTIDPSNPNKVYLGGGWEVDGSWGRGGAIYTLDGGLTWLKNEDMPLKANLRMTVLDPNDPNRLFYLFFGGGMLHGPRP